MFEKFFFRKVTGQIIISSKEIKRHTFRPRFRKNFLDPFNNNQQQQRAPPPAVRSTQNVNYGGAQQRQNGQAQTNYQQNYYQQQQQQQQQQKRNNVGMGALSMLDPLAQNKGPVVRELSKAVSISD